MISISIKHWILSTLLLYILFSATAQSKTRTLSLKSTKFPTKAETFIELIKIGSRALGAISGVGDSSRTFFDQGFSIKVSLPFFKDYFKLAFSTGPVFLVGFAIGMTILGLFSVVFLPFFFGLKYFLIGFLYDYFTPKYNYQNLEWLKNFPSHSHSSHNHNNDFSGQLNHVPEYVHENTIGNSEKFKENVKNLPLSTAESFNSIKSLLPSNPVNMSQVNDFFSQTVPNFIDSFVSANYVNEQKATNSSNKTENASNHHQYHHQVKNATKIYNSSQDVKDSHGKMVNLSLNKNIKPKDIESLFRELEINGSL